MANPLGEQWLSYLRVGARMNQAIERALSSRYGLCVSAFEIMDVMRQQRDWVRAGEISSRSSRSQPQVSRLLSQMINAEYVERKPAPGDGRGSEVRLTASGQEIFQKASETVETVLTELAEEDPDTETLIRPSTATARIG
ncbi:MarR family winged helix-turn-helix transcriptional regulator [Streptomyces sp. NPDC046860]|uniref:MarR family winged helix-turn-helix transcriptional regulator n=1 Tax=Streptomyces sp. NPDC046860 TaxID=3154495 RepID=UPI0033E76189